MGSGVCRRLCATRRTVGWGGARRFSAGVFRQAGNAATATCACAQRSQKMPPTSHHRAVSTTSGGSEFQYKLNDRWCAEESVDVGAVRAYELTLLRRGGGRPRKETQTCAKDEHRAVSESF